MALVQIDGSASDNTSAHVLSHEPGQSNQSTRQEFTNVNEREQNTNAITGQKVFPTSRPYPSGQISQSTVTPFASNATSSGIPTTNSQLESDLLRSQPQWEFTNTLNPTYHSAQKWESFKHIIVGLYSETHCRCVKSWRPWKENMDSKQGKPQVKPQVLRLIDRSARMYKCRIDRWGLKKNATRRDVISILHKTRQRASFGKGTVPSRNSREIDIKRYVKRAKIAEYDLMDPSEIYEVPRGVELRTPSPSNNSTTCPPVLQLLTGWKTIKVKNPWTAARYHRINRAASQLGDSYKLLTDGRTRDSGVMLRLAFARIIETFDAMSPTCILSSLLGFHRVPHAGLSDIIWRYLSCLTRERYSKFHLAHLIFSSIYRLLQRYGFVVYHSFLTECLPTLVDIMMEAYNLMDPFVVDSVLELAVLFGYGDKFQLEKVLDGLKEAEVSAEESGNPLERRSYIMEILALIEDGTTKTSRLSFLRKAYSISRGLKSATQPTRE